MKYRQSHCRLSYYIQNNHCFNPALPTAGWLEKIASRGSLLPQTEAGSRNYGTESAQQRGGSRPPEADFLSSGDPLSSAMLWP